MVGISKMTNDLQRKWHQYFSTNPPTPSGGGRSQHLNIIWYINSLVFNGGDFKKDISISVQTPRGSNSQTHPWCFGLWGKRRLNSSYYVTCHTLNSYFTFKLIVHNLFLLHVSFVFSFKTVFPESPKQVGLSGVGPRSSCPPALH